MQYAMIGYGDLIYHSSIEWQELADSASNENAQLYQYQLNTPISSARVWDTVGQSDYVDVPSQQLTTFDLSLCRKPSSIAVQ